MIVESLAKKNLVTARSDETVREAVRRMAQKRVGAILVVDNGRLSGIFSERDALKRVLARGLDPGSTPLGEVHTPNPLTVSRNTNVRECVEMVRDHRIRHLPVVDEAGRPVGIVSVRDFLRLVVARLEGLIERVHGDHRIQELTDPYEHFDL